VRESIDRVITAVKNSGLRRPSKRITINLAPADLRREGPGFELPIAIGMVSLAQESNGALTDGALTKWALWGYRATFLDSNTSPPLHRPPGPRREGSCGMKKEIQ
jgi:hypothetical protein